MKQFFSSDNIVSIILFIAGYIISAIYSTWRNQKGRWIIVEKVSEGFIFVKPSEMNDELGIEIRANNQPIKSLVQTQLIIKNTGSDITDPIDITLMFKNQKTGETTEVLGLRGRQEYLVFLPDSLHIHKPFFNSSRAYGDVLNVYIYSENSITVKVKGSGWKAKYIDKVQQQTRIKQAFTNSILASLGIEKLSTIPLQKNENSDDETWIGMA